MVAAVAFEPSPLEADRLVAFADRVVAEFASGSHQLGGLEDAQLIDLIAALERVRGATAGLQAAATVRFGQRQVEAQLAADFDPRQVGRGIADQIALARRMSPAAGARWLGQARAWCLDLPQTFLQLLHGGLHEAVAATVVTETRHLSKEQRQQVDHDLAGQDLGSLGVRKAESLIRATAYRIDPEGYTARGRTERQHRRVGLRPKPDTMSLLTGYLPVEQGVACLSALRKHTDARKAAGDGRTRDQIMAETLVERVTGQSAAPDVPVEVQITIPVDALQAADGRGHGQVAFVRGAGPLPAGLAAGLIDRSAGRKWWRRLFTAPASGVYVGGDPHRRRFTGALSRLIVERDQTCRTPYCDAPIRNIDHITRWTEGGLTTLINGRGTCVRCNQTREARGWTVRTISRSTAEVHVVETITPTGHRYRSRAPDPP